MDVFKFEFVGSKISVVFTDAKDITQKYNTWPGSKITVCFWDVAGRPPGHDRVVVGAARDSVTVPVARAGTAVPAASTVRAHE